jgi:glycosyltransferase involved in cell wall biosynthesis
VKVLFVTPMFHPATVYGGTTASGLGFSRGLDGLGCEVVVLTTTANGAEVLDVPESVPLGARSQILYAPRLALQSTSPRLLSLLRREALRADVLALNMTFSFPTFPVVTAARLLQKPLVWAPRGAVLALAKRPPAKKRAWLEAMRRALPQDTRAHCTSPAEAAAVERWFPGLSTFVVPNGVDIPNTVARHEVADALHIVTVGRLNPIKGLDRLLDALAGLTFAWRCTIAGDGESSYREELQRRAASLGIATRVQFTGHLEAADRDALLASADVYVCASHTENFGQSIAEALAIGLPVIASRGTPWSDLETHHCGAWVPNTPGALRDALSKTAGSDRAAMGARGRAWMSEAFSWESASRRWIDAVG